MRLAAAVAVARGVGIASSNNPIEAAYARAVSLEPAEAEELLYRTNAARQTARARARKGY